MAEVSRLHLEVHGTKHPAMRGRVTLGQMRKRVWDLMDAVGGESVVLAALRAFYADAYWKEHGHPFLAFAKQVTRYVREAEKTKEADRGTVDAEQEFERDVARFKRGCR